MSNTLTDKALVVIAALGGRENIVDVYACITRLRVEVKNTDIVEWDKIKSVGAVRRCDLRLSYSIYFW